MPADGKLASMEGDDGVGSFGVRSQHKIPDLGASRLVGDDGRGVGCRRRRKRRGREERSFATSGWRRKRPAGFARYPLRPILPLSSSPPPNIHHAYAPQSSVIPGEQTTRFARPGILKTRGEGIGRSNFRRATAVCRSARSTQPRHEKIPDLGASRLVGDDGERWCGVGVTWPSVVKLWFETGLTALVTPKIPSLTLPRGSELCRVQAANHSRSVGYKLQATHYMPLFRFPGRTREAGETRGPCRAVSRRSVAADRHSTTYGLGALAPPGKQPRAGGGWCFA